MSARVWVGRVFCDGERGGNHTAVLFGHSPSRETAASLGFPDSAFVTIDGPRAVRVRTFSPREEMAQCLQALLAVPVACGARDGETWRVRHPAGSLSVVVTQPVVVTEESAGRWTCWLRDTDTAPGPPSPVGELPPWARGVRSAVRLAQGRSRLYLEVADIADVVPPTAAEVLACCAVHDVAGVVFFAAGEQAAGEFAARMRVFTTSLGGHEDVATGGAAAGVGALLSARDVTGLVRVIQGPDDPFRQGHILLRLDGERFIGGEVRPLLVGDPL